MSTAETVVVEVIARLDKAKNDIKGLDTQFDTSTKRMQGSTRSIESALNRVAQSSTSSFNKVGTSSKSAANDVERSAARINNANRNIGRQIADIGAQASGGQSPFLIFAQQAPQLADALADTGGRAAKVASFFAGPWGAAILAAGSILGTLIPRLLDAGDASAQMTKEQIDLANFVDKATGAINRQTTAVQRLAAAQARQTDVESGTKSYNAMRGGVINAVRDAAGQGKSPTPTFVAGVQVPGAAPAGVPIKQRLREIAAEAVRTRQPINDFALAVRAAVGDRPEYRALVKTVTAQAAATVSAAQGVERLKAEQAVLTGTATKAQRALLGLGLATSGLIEQQVALATATTATEKARARLAIVQDRGRNIVAGDGAALTQYRSDLTAATRAVQSAEAAEKSAAQSKRDSAKAARETAKAERERLKAIRESARAERELIGLRSDLLASKSDLTSDTRQQDEFSRQRIRLDQAGQTGRLDEQRDRGELTKPEYDARKKLVDEIADNRVLLVNRNEFIRFANEQLEAAKTQIDRQRDTLQAEESLARTAKERGAIQLKLLDLGIEEQRLSAQKVLDLAAQNKATPQEAALAQGTIDALPSVRRLGEAQIAKDNKGPLGAYLDSIPRSADEINEAMQGVAVGGIQNVTDGLATAASGFLKLRGVAGQAISGIIADLARLALQRGILSLLGSVAGGGGGIGSIAASAIGGGGLVDSNPDRSFADAMRGILGGSGSVASMGGSGLPRLAGGGTIRAGGMGGVDQNVLSVNGRPRAMIGAHEMLGVVNPNVRAVSAGSSNTTNHFHIAVDSRNSVTPQGFAQEIVEHSVRIAAQMDARSAKQTLQSTPGYMAHQQAMKY